jgi:hypothetical protein
MQAARRGNPSMGATRRAQPPGPAHANNQPLRDRVFVSEKQAWASLRCISMHVFGDIILIYIHNNRAEVMPAAANSPPAKAWALANL